MRSQVRTLPGAPSATSPAGPRNSRQYDPALPDRHAVSHLAVDIHVVHPELARSVGVAHDDRQAAGVQPAVRRRDSDHARGRLKPRLSGPAPNAPKHYTSNTKQTDKQENKSDPPASTHALGNQLPRVHDAQRIERLLDRPQRVEPSGRREARKFVPL